MEFRQRPLGFMEFFCKTTIIRQLRKLNESKITKNTVKKTVGILYESSRVIVSVWVCTDASLGYSCVLLCVCIDVSEVQTQHVVLSAYKYVAVS